MIRLAGIFRNETDQKNGGDAMERAGQRFPGAEEAVPAAAPGELAGEQPGMIHTGRNQV